MTETFFLSGNGSYGNKGCEAIVRGTAKIIRKVFSNPDFQCYSTFENEDYFKMQSANEIDKSVIHREIFRPNRLGMVTFRALEPFNIGFRQNYEYKEMTKYLDEATAVLSVGGDTYALDWGIPKLYTDLNDVVTKSGKPLIIWAASIGPFDSKPKYEKAIMEKLKNVDGLFVREPNTIQYLKDNGITDNVYHVGDPAFVMDPIKPAEEIASIIEEDSIGINLSALMARFIPEVNNRNEWIDLGAKLISQIYDKFERNIYLIPHVTRPVPTDNDHIFLNEILSKIDTSTKEVHLLPPDLSAAESKWVIGKMAIFMGSRMHSNIAALSSCVPTLSLAYSIKARGINIDIFGTDEYCLQPGNINIENVLNITDDLLNNEQDIRTKLETEIPSVQQRAYNAGKYLKEIIS